MPFVVLLYIFQLSYSQNVNMYKKSLILWIILILQHLSLSVMWNPQPESAVSAGGQGAVCGRLLLLFQWESEGAGPLSLPHPSPTDHRHAVSIAAKVACWLPLSSLSILTPNIHTYIHTHQVILLRSQSARPPAGDEHHLQLAFEAVRAVDWSARLLGGRPAHFRGHAPTHPDLAESGRLAREWLHLHAGYGATRLAKIFYFFLKCGIY